MNNDSKKNELQAYHMPLLVAGVVHMNAGLIYDDLTGEAMLIDPGGEANKIIAVLNDKKLSLKYIAITHGHFDHIMAVSELKAQTGALVCMSAKDACFIKDSRLNAVYVRNLPPVPKFQVDRYLENGETINLGEKKVKVIETPGHTPGHLSYYIPGHLFSGDTILKGTTGRMDLKGADISVIERSICKKLLLFPPETIIHCGHGEATTVSYERKYNDIFKRSVKN